MNVKVIRAGHNSDGHDFPLDRLVGDVYKVKDWYGKWLIEQGFAVQAEDVSMVLAKQGQTSEPEYEDDPDGELEGSVLPPNLAINIVEVKPEEFGHLPGITPEIEAQFYLAGINSIEQFKAAVLDGTVINVPGMSITKAKRLKKPLGITEG